MYPARESDSRVLFKPIPECGEGGCHARIWVPKTPINGDIRVVLMFHGGGFGFGQDSDVPAPEVDYLNEKGIVVVSAQYRLAPHVKFPEIVDDLCDAYAWVWSDLTKHVPGAERVKAVAVEGWSAGGASSCLLGGFYAKRGLPKPSALNVHYGWIDINAKVTAKESSAPYDMAELMAEPVSTGFPLSQGQVTPPTARMAWLREAMHNNKLPLALHPEGSTYPLPPTYNPLELVGPEFPPTYVMVATKDDLISPQQSYDLIAKLKQYGVDHAVGEADMVHGRSENCPPEEREDYERWFNEAIRPGLDWVIERLG